MHDYPSVSQTFVVTEAAALKRLGVPVVGYALNRGAALRSAAPLELICPPPTRLQLLVAALTGAFGIVALTWQARQHRLSVREATRLYLAYCHATHALRHSKAAGVAHIHAHFLGRSADVATLLAARLGCRWTATSHAGDAYAPSEPALLRSRLRSVAAVACTSRSVQDSLTSHMALGSTRLAVLHGGVDTSAMRFRSARDRDSPRHLVTVGRLVATKGHWTILESADSLMRRDTSLQWTVVGDGPLRDQLIGDARRRGLTPRLSFVGALAHDAILTLLREADGFVLPCEEDERGSSDGIPFALMEAMALGVPVVTSPVGGIRELVEPDATGFLVSPRDPAALTAAVERTLYPERPECLEGIREAARIKVEQEFDLSQQARALLQLLEPYLPLT